MITDTQLLTALNVYHEHEAKSHELDYYYTKHEQLLMRQTLEAYEQSNWKFGEPPRDGNEYLAQIFYTIHKNEAQSEYRIIKFDDDMWSYVPDNEHVGNVSVDFIYRHQLLTPKE